MKYVFWTYDSALHIDYNCMYVKRWLGEISRHLSHYYFDRICAKPRVCISHWLERKVIGITNSMRKQGKLSTICHPYTCPARRPAPRCSAQPAIYACSHVLRWCPAQSSWPHMRALVTCQHTYPHTHSTHSTVDRTHTHIHLVPLTSRSWFGFGSHRAACWF